VKKNQIYEIILNHTSMIDISGLFAGSIVRRRTDATSFFFFLASNINWLLSLSKQKFNSHEEHYFLSFNSGRMLKLP